MSTVSPDGGTRPLDGCRVLVPRGGSWGDHVAATLRRFGATPVIAPLINFAPAQDQQALEHALADLAAGTFAWLTVTSATAADVLHAYRAVIPQATRIAAVGTTTAAALETMGYRVDLVPHADNSAAAMAEELIAREPEPRDVLALRGEAATPVTKIHLEAAGHRVRSVIAYRTVGVPATDRIAADVSSGRINAILVTSGSVAEQVRVQFPDVPESTVLAVVGQWAAQDAHREVLGDKALGSDGIATVLTDALDEVPLPHATDEFAL